MNRQQQKDALMSFDRWWRSKGVDDALKLFDTKSTECITVAYFAGYANALKKRKKP